MVGKGKEIAVGSSIDESSVESHKYYLARRTTMEMLRDRGYDVSDENINLSLQDFRALHGQHPNVDQIRISVKHCLDSSKKIVVVFCGSNVVKVNEIRVIAADVLSRESITGLILVLQSHITDQALKAIELFSFKVELFQITDLLVNVTKHVLRPKHQVLTDKEKESLLKKFSIEEKQLPRISKKDPIVRYYGLEKGQVVKVTYKDERNESHVTYRCVSFTAKSFLLQSRRLKLMLLLFHGEGACVCQKVVAAGLPAPVASVAYRTSCGIWIARATQA